MCVPVCMCEASSPRQYQRAPPVMGGDRALNSSTECTTAFSLFLFGPTEHVAVTDPSLRATGCSSVCT